jgi:hypothetical protein
MAFLEPGFLPRLRCYLRLAVTLTITLTLAPLSPTQALAGVPPADPRWIAGAVCQKGEKQETVARAEVAGISFTAEPLDTSQWEARLEHQASGMGAALRGHDGSEGPFQVFLLTLRNQSPEVLRFQPGNIVRIVGSKQQDHIMDYTDLYRYLMEEGKNPDSLERLRGAFFDTGLALDRGETVERLLFFRALPPKIKKKQLTLLLSSFQVGTETLRAALSWHAEKERK